MRIERWPDPEFPRDLGDLIAEARRDGRDWIDRFEQSWRDRPFRGPGEALFIAYDGATPVATAAISMDPYVGDRTGRLRFIYVRAAARRGGLGRRLLETCLRHAAGHWRRLRLHTDNPLAARLYAEYGFGPVAEPHTTHAADSAAVNAALRSRGSAAEV